MTDSLREREEAARLAQEAALDHAYRTGVADGLDAGRREQVAPVDIDGCAACGFHCTHDALINTAYQQGLAAARREQGDAVTESRTEMLRELLDALDGSGDVARAQSPAAVWQEAVLRVREQGARDEALREAIAQERAQFQRETLRTSELHRMLERAGSYIRDVDGPDSPLARAFAREILELLSKPINAAAPATEENTNA